MEETPTSPPTTLIQGWLSELGLSTKDSIPLRGDVSSRRYYRVELEGGAATAQTAIVAVYPQKSRSVCHRFVQSTRLLEDQGIRVPTILAYACTKGLMLLEDLGPRTLYDRRDQTWSVLEPFLRAAGDVIDKLRRLPPGLVSKLNPPLDGEVLRRELQLTWDVFLAPGDLCGQGSDQRRFQEALDLLCERLDPAATVPSHRDFMARNLVPIEPSPNLAILDHQDLRLAPAAYDVACLCNDSLYPPAEVAARLAGTVDKIEYHRCAAQRTLKVVGTFVSFAQRGSRRYLELVPTSLRKCLEHLSKLPEGQPVVKNLERSWRPVLRKSSI